LALQSSRRLGAGLLLASAALLAAPELSPAQEPGEPRLLEVDDLFRLHRVGSPAISPEGEWVAYTVSSTSLEDESSETRLWMVSSTGGEPLPMTRKGESVSAPAWSPDGRYLSFLASRGEGARTQVWLLDRRGGEAWALTDVKQGVNGYEWSPDGTRLVLLIRDPEPSDSARKADSPQEPWVIDRLQFKRDGAGYLTGDRRTHLYVLDLASRDLRQITTGRWDEGSPAWSPDGHRIAFVSNRTEEPDGNSNSDVWVVAADLEEPTETPNRVTSNPGEDGSPTWSPDGSRIAYVTVTEPELIWYATNHLAIIDSHGGEATLLTETLDRNVGSPRFGRDGRIYFRLEDSAENHIASINPDGTDLTRLVAGPVSAGRFDLGPSGEVVVQVARTDLPGDVFRFVDGSESGGVRLTAVNDSLLSGVRLGEVREIRWVSPDGNEVEGFLHFPPDFGAGTRYPLLLRPHGGPVSQYSHSFNFDAHLFAANGYLVLSPNPRGSSGYGQDFSAALWANWGTPDFRDVMSGVDHVIEEGWADPDRMGVGGWSYGGILTNYVVTQTDRFKGAVSGASEVLYIANYGHDHYQLQWEKELGLPWEGNNREVWERISPFNRVAEITTPTLLMGGEKDWNVPILNSEQMYQALRRRGVPTQLVVYPGQGHGLRIPSYQKDRLQRYLEWYGRWVKGDDPPPVT
jgi:dipeptidyl aminopeptidase/acylaminoacyl peptidase